MSRERQFRILIIEDEARLAQHLAHRVDALSASYQVVGIAYNGSEGLELMSQHKPDIVFTDIRMSVMDGLAFLDEATRAYPKVKYVILSSFSDFGYAQAAIRYGVKDYLLKPISEDVCCKG